LAKVAPSWQIMAIEASGSAGLDETVVVAWRWLDCGSFLLLAGADQADLP
jgi:hypothetical protein